MSRPQGIKGSDLKWKHLFFPVRPKTLNSKNSKKTKNKKNPFLM